MTESPRPPASPAELDEFERRIDTWLSELARGHPAIEAVERGEPGERRWYVRLRGDERDVSTVWFTLGQRTLRHETYVLPAPRRRVEAVHAQLLKRNLDLAGVHFALGAEDAVFLVGRSPLHCVDAAELDRILGTVWSTIERSFRSLVRLGFGPPGDS